MAYILILADSDEREIHDDAKHEKLKSVLDELELKASPIYVSVNGKRKRYWKNYVPQEGDIVFCYFEEWHIFSAIFITAGAITLGVASSVTAVAFGVGLLGIGIGLLVNEIWGNDASTGNSSYDSNSDSLKDVSGTDMQISPGSKVPLQFGGTWYRPDLLCEPHEYSGGSQTTWPDANHWGQGDEDDGYRYPGGIRFGKESGNKNISPTAYIGDASFSLRLCCCVGYASDVAKPTSVYIVNQPISHAGGSISQTAVAWDSCLSKGINRTVTPAFRGRTDVGVVSAIDRNMGATGIEIILFQQGMWEYNKEEYFEDVQFNTFRYTVAFDDNGTYTGTFTAIGRKKDSFFYRVYLPAQNAYQITIHSVAGDARWRDAVLVGNVTIKQIRFIFNKTTRPILKNNEVRALSISFTNQYQTDSSDKKILALCLATWRNCSTLATYTCASGKGNPADGILYAATSKHCLGSNALKDNQIDMDALKKFRAYCDKRNYNYVASVTDGRAFQDLIMHIALVGHSRMAYDKYGRLTIITDDYYDSNYNSIAAPVVCLINSTNTIKDSWKVTKSNIDYSQKPTVLRINFVDHNTRQESVGYVFLDARRYYKSSTVSAANLKTFDQVVNSIDYTKDVVTTISIDDYEGIRDPKHVFEMGRRQILKQYYTTTEVTFTMGIQANGLAMWDRVWLGHTLLANSIVSGKIIEKTVNGNTVTLRLDRAILYEIPSTLDDAQLRDINAPRSQIIINHIDLANSSNSFNRSYTMTTSPSNDFVVTLTVASNDPLKTVEIGEQDVYSIANGYFDGIIVGRKPKDDKMTELTVTDYLFDATCTPSNPFTTYNTAARLKYGNPYWTYKETVPHFWGNSVSNNP